MSSQDQVVHDTLICPSLVFVIFTPCSHRFFSAARCRTSLHLVTENTCGPLEPCKAIGQGVRDCWQQDSDAVGRAVALTENMLAVNTGWRRSCVWSDRGMYVLTLSCGLDGWFHLSLTFFHFSLSLFLAKSALLGISLTLTLTPPLDIAVVWCDDGQSALKYARNGAGMRRASKMGAPVASCRLQEALVSASQAADTAPAAMAMQTAATMPDTTWVAAMLGLQMTPRSGCFQNRSVEGGDHRLRRMRCHWTAERAKQRAG